MLYLSLSGTHSRHGGMKSCHMYSGCASSANTQEARFRELGDELDSATVQ